MKKYVWMLGILAMAAGCGSTVNQDACKGYVEHLNGLTCRDTQVDQGATCPDSLDAEGSASCAEFYGCLTEAARCDGDTFVNNAEQECPTCAIPEK